MNNLQIFLIKLNKDKYTKDLKIWPRKFEF